MSEYRRFTGVLLLGRTHSVEFLRSCARSRGRVEVLRIGNVQDQKPYKWGMGELDSRIFYRTSVGRRSEAVGRPIRLLDDRRARLSSGNSSSSWLRTWLNA
jgi:hypothetical protein